MSWSKDQSQQLNKQTGLMDAMQNMSLSQQQQNGGFQSRQGGGGGGGAFGTGYGGAGLHQQQQQQPGQKSSSAGVGVAGGGRLSQKELEKQCADHLGRAMQQALSRGGSLF